MAVGGGMRLAIALRHVRMSAMLLLLRMVRRRGRVAGCGVSGSLAVAAAAASAVEPSGLPTVGVAMRRRGRRDGVLVRGSILRTGCAGVVRLGQGCLLRLLPLLGVHAGRRGRLRLLPLLLLGQVHPGFAGLAMLLDERRLCRRAGKGAVGRLTVERGQRGSRRAALLFARTAALSLLLGPHFVAVLSEDGRGTRR